MADKPKVKPSSAGVWIGLVMMLLSFVSCGAGCALAASEVKDAADSADRIPVGTSQTYNMTSNAAGIIIGLAPSASDAKSINATLKDPDGNDVKLSSSTSFSSTSNTDSQGEAVEVLGTFEAKKAGTYTLTAEGPTGSKVAILNISISSILSKFFGGVGLGFVLFIGGLILAIVTGVRRGKAKKRMAAGGYGSPPAGMPPQMPPTPGGGYPPAPGGYPQTPQQPYPPAPSAPGGYPPAPAPAPGGYPPGAGGFPPAPAPPTPAPGGYPPPPEQPSAPPPAPPAQNDPPPPPPPPPGQWGNDTPPAAPPFGS